MDFEQMLLQIVDFINNEEFNKAEELIRDALAVKPNDCELNFLYGVSAERQGLYERAFYLYRLGVSLATTKEDEDIVKEAFNNLVNNVNVSMYELGKALQEIVSERIRLGEYERTNVYLNEILYDGNNHVAAKIALTEENMLLSMLLEIVLCEKNRQSGVNTALAYDNDIYRFKEAYVELKFCLRRIWFGCNELDQRRIVDVIRKYNISGDMVAVGLKYGVVQEFWFDCFDKIIQFLKEDGDKALEPIAERIQAYRTWLEDTGVGVQMGADETSNFDNGFEYIRLDYNNSCEKVSNDNAFAIIMCTNDELYEKECLIYLKKLKLPEGMKLKVVSVWNAPSMAAGYNLAMDTVNARYRLYIHHDTFVIKDDCLIKLAKAFEADSELGMIGIFGSMDQVDSALWYKSEWETTRLNLYQDAILNIRISFSNNATHEVEPACMIDGVFMATSKDVRWREDLFDGWHYYDISQGYEMRKAGFKTGFLIDNEGYWVMHETTMRKDPKDLYGKYRQIFIDNYY